MKLLWNGENIEPKVDIQDIIMHDQAGGLADSIDIIFPDPEQAWAKWQPQKGDEIEVSVDGYSTGLMYFDGWIIEGQTYKAMAISSPEKGKSEAFRAWNEATFMEIAREVAAACGLSLETYDIADHTYDRVEQKGSGNLLFLKCLCEREGYCLKCNNGKAVVFGEKAFECKTSVKTISKSQMVGRSIFKSIAIDLKAQGIIKYYDSGNNLLEYTHNVPEMYGGTLRVTEHAASIGEAERFLKAALRQANKNESQGFFTVQLDTTIAAAVNINIEDLGAADGKWYLTRVDHSLLNGYTYCWCRKGIEGDY